MVAKRKRRLLLVAFLRVAVILPMGLALASTHQAVDHRGSGAEADLTTDRPGRPLSSLPSIQADALRSSGNINASGGQLVLNGVPHHVVGVNAYELATDWGTNAGCGAMLSNTQLNTLFASLPANSLVRFWAFQGSMAINIKTHQIDWAPLVFACLRQPPIMASVSSSRSPTRVGHVTTSIGRTRRGTKVDSPMSSTLHPRPMVGDSPHFRTGTTFGRL